MAKKPQVAGRCVFCNGFKLTKEHIWSDFLTIRGLIEPSDNHAFHQVYSKDAGDFTIISGNPPKRKNGALAQKKMRNVCETCNNGWMRDIVNHAIPIVENLILNDKRDLSEDDQSGLAAWICIATIVAEFTHPPTAATPKEDRKALMASSRPPDSWSIFIGRYQGVEWANHRYRHHGLDFGITDQPGPKAVEGVRIHKAQATTYTLNKLAIHAISADWPFMADAVRDHIEFDGMTRIWPINGPASLSHNILDDLAIKQVAEEFWRGAMTLRK